MDFTTSEYLKQYQNALVSIAWEHRFKYHAAFKNYTGRLYSNLLKFCVLILFESNISLGFHSKKLFEVAVGKVIAHYWHPVGATFLSSRGHKLIGIIWWKQDQFAQPTAFQDYTRGTPNANREKHLSSSEGNEMDER